MNSLSGAEAFCRDVIALDNVQHLRDMHAGRRERRRTENLPTPIVRAHRSALDGPVRRKVFAGDEAVMHHA